MEQIKLGEKSEHWDYVGNLPTDLSHYPALFTAEDGPLTKACYQFNMQIGIHQQKIGHNYKELVEAVPSIKDTISLEDFAFGFTLVASRAYPLGFQDNT